MIFQGAEALPLALVGLDKDLLDTVGSRIVAIFDPRANGEICGVPVIGGDDAWPAYKVSHPSVKPLIAIDLPRLRRKLSAHYGAEDCATFIAADAKVSRHAIIGTGVVIQRGVYVSADVELADAVRINVGAQIHHDCRLSSFVTVAPGALLMGSVRVGRDAYIGAGAVVRQGLTIGEGAVVGAGAVVTRPVAAGVTVVGAPAKPIARA